MEIDDNELNEQLNMLKELNKELDNYENKINECFEIKNISEKIEKCNAKTRANINWAASYGIYTNYYLYLMLSETNPIDHPLYNEIKRLQEYKEKINKTIKGIKEETIQDKKNSDNNGKRHFINKEVAENMIRNHLKLNLKK